MLSNSKMFIAYQRHLCQSETKNHYLKSETFRSEDVFVSLLLTSNYTTQNKIGWKPKITTAKSETLLSL